MPSDNAIITRCAPQWAWDMIDETLMLDSQSSAFDRDLRDAIGSALRAMVYASENPQLDELSESDIPADF